jgi:hypothetical protein
VQANQQLLFHVWHYFSPLLRNFGATTRYWQLLLLALAVVRNGQELGV